MLDDMTGAEFIRKVHRLGRRKGISVRLLKARGKGSHQTLFYGNRRTIVRDPKDELRAGTLAAMLRQLGLSKNDLL